MTTPFPEPTAALGDEAAVLLAYLDHFRGVVLEAVRGLPEAERRTSRLASGWTPAELVVHLQHVERRWLEWGFEGVDLADPWGDQVDGRWYAPVPTEDLLTALEQRGADTRRIVRRHRLDEVGRPGERWEGADPAPLRRVLLHLLQEYARHAGHLDVVVELSPGSPPAR